MDCFAALAMSKEHHTREGGYPVRRGLSLPSLLSLEYWIVRPSAQLRTRRTMTTKYRFAFSRPIAPEVCMNLSPPRKRRVQGMPGARCTRGLVCNVCIEMRTRAYRYSRNTPAFPAQGSVWGQKVELIQRDATVVFTFVSRSAIDLAAERNMGTCWRL
jgi:hypothetical protein